MSVISVLLVDDQRLLRDSLRTLLELEDDIRVVGEAANGAEVMAAYEAHQPDVVVMDIRMPTMDGVEATQRLITRHSQARVLILTTFLEDELVVKGIQAGALGYLLKDVSGDELARAVRTVAGGNVLIGAQMAQMVLGSVRLTVAKPLEPSPLTVRESEILQLIAEGLSNGEIGRRLHLAEGTIKNYVSNMLQKTGARDRTQAVVLGKEKGWL